MKQLRVEVHTLKRLTNNDRTEKDRIKRLNEEIAKEIEDQRTRNVELEKRLTE